MTDLVLRELRQRHAQLELQAEKLRSAWRDLPTSARALAMGKRIKETQRHADAYARLIEKAEEML